MPFDIYETATKLLSHAIVYNIEFKFYFHLSNFKLLMIKQSMVFNSHKYSAT